MFFYEAGLDVPLDVFRDSDLEIPWAQPIVLNAAAEADGPIYVSPSPAYKVVYKDANNVPIPGYPVDGVSPSTIVNVVTTARVSLTNAQIKALPTTAVTLVAAPASGLRVRVSGLSYSTDTSAGAYTNINATYADLHTLPNYVVYGPIKDTSTTPAITTLTNMLGATGQSTYDVSAVPNAVAIGAAAGYVLRESLPARTEVNGVAVTLVMDNNGSGNLTGGNAANSMLVTIYYTLESLS